MSGINQSEAAIRERRASMTPIVASVTVPAPSGPNPLDGRRALREAATIELARIIPDPDQPREEFEPAALQRLADSMQVRGQLQPIRVRWDDGKGAYVVIVGERRYRAAQLAGLTSLACIVVNGSMTPDELLIEQLIENCVREDLRPVEQARAFKTLMERMGLSQRALAAQLNIAQATVSETLSLLALPPEVKDSIDAGTIAPSTAVAAAKIADPEKRSALLANAARGEVRRDEVRAMSRRAARADKPRPLKFTQGGFTVTIAIEPEASTRELIVAVEGVLKTLRKAEKRQSSDAA